MTSKQRVLTALSHQQPDKIPMDFGGCFITGIHSCGAVETLIPDFIASGFDILNPVQCSAKGMEAPGLKQKYGKDIPFWGGGVNTQATLPFGTAEEVRREVLSRCETFAPDGGFVFNAIHNVQALSPIENVVAMIDAVHEFNGDK